MHFRKPKVKVTQNKTEAHKTLFYKKEKSGL